MGGGGGETASVTLLSATGRLPQLECLNVQEACQYIFYMLLSVVLEKLQMFAVMTFSLMSFHFVHKGIETSCLQWLTHTEPGIEATIAAWSYVHIYKEVSSIEFTHYSVCIGA